MLVGRSFFRSVGWPLALAIALSVGCGPERLEKAESDLAASIVATEARGDTVTLNLFTVVPFAYDRVYIAGPRTPADTLAAVIGGDWSLIGQSLSGGFVMRRVKSGTKAAARKAETNVVVVEFRKARRKAPLKIR